MLTWRISIINENDLTCEFKDFIARITPNAVMDSKSPTGARMVWCWEIGNGKGWRFTGVANSQDKAKSQVERVIAEETTGEDT